MLKVYAHLLTFNLLTFNLLTFNLLTFNLLTFNPLRRTPGLHDATCYLLPEAGSVGGVGLESLFLGFPTLLGIE